MKRRLLIGLLAGVLLLAILLAEIGISPTLEVVLAAGFVLLLLIPLHFIPLLFDVLGWQALLLRTVPISRLLWIAVMREAVGRLLPVANAGGELAGIRLLLKTASVDAPTAIVSVIAETLLTVIARSLFVVIGAICLLDPAFRQRRAAIKNRRRCLLRMPSRKSAEKGVNASQNTCSSVAHSSD